MNNLKNIFISILLLCSTFLFGFDSNDIKDTKTSKGSLNDSTQNNIEKVLNLILGTKTKNLQDYTKAIELNPKDAGAYYNRGVAKAKLKDYAGALDDLSEAGQLGETKAYEVIPIIQEMMRQ